MPASVEVGGSVPYVTMTEQPGIRVSCLVVQEDSMPRSDGPVGERVACFLGTETASQTNWFPVSTTENYRGTTHV